MALEDRYPLILLSPVIQSLRLADGFVRNVVVLLSGTMAAFIIPVAVAPLLSRLYSPEDYGCFTLFVSLASIISVVINGSYDTAIVLPERDEDGMSLVAVCLTLSFCVSSFLLLPLWLLNQEISALLGGATISLYLYVVPFTAFMLVSHQTLTLWANRKKRFRKLALNRVVDSAISPVPSIALGLHGFGASGLVIGFLTGKAAAIAGLARDFWREKRRNHAAFEKRSMLRIAKCYRDFPLFSAPASLLDALAVQAPVLFMANFFGPVAVGLFALVTRVIASPLFLAGSSVGQVFHQWVAEAVLTNSSVRSPLLKVALCLALTIAGPFLLVALFGPPLFSFIFGDQWRTGGEYAQILMFPIALRFVVNPLSVVMSATGNIKMGAIWRMGYFIGIVPVLFVASRFNAKAFLFIYSAYDLVLYTCHFFLILWASGNLNCPTQERKPSDA